jgi:hypothetical protein
MTWLRRTVHDELEWPDRAKELLDAGAIPNIEIVVSKVSRRGPQSFEIPPGIAAGTEEVGAHVVVEANHSMAS